MQGFISATTVRVANCHTQQLFAVAQALALYLQDAPLVQQEVKEGGALTTLDTIFSTCDHDSLASASIAQV